MDTQPLDNVFDKILLPRAYFYLSLAIIGIVLGVSVLPFWINATHLALQYPYSMDNAEGSVLIQVLHLLTHKDLYPQPTDPEFVTNYYTPLYYYAVGAISRLGIDILYAGRILSLVSVFLIAGVLSGITHILLKSRNTSQNTRLFFSALCGILFISNHYVEEWGPLMRVDLFAIFWEYLGLLLFLGLTKNSYRIIASVVCYLLAFYTKQSFIMIPIACVISSFFYERKFCLQFTFTLGVATLVSLAFAYYVTDGAFFMHILSANLNPIYYQRILIRLIELFVLYGSTLFICLYGIIMYLRAYCLGKIHHSSPQARYLGCALCWILAFIAMGSIGKVGSNINYMLEFIAIHCVVLSMLLHRACTKPLHTVGQSFIVLALLQIIGGVFAPHPELENLEQSYPQNMKEGAEIVQYMSSTPGEMIVADPILLYRSGKEVFFDIWGLSLLNMRAPFDPSHIIEKLNAKKIVAIVLDDPIETSYIPGHLTYQDMPLFYHAFRKAIATNYSLTRRIGRYYVYEPSPSMSEKQ